MTNKLHYSRVIWYYLKYISAKYNILSTLLLEKDIKENDIIIVKINKNYIRTNNIKGQTPADTTRNIIEFLKNSNPEYFL